MELPYFTKIVLLRKNGAILFLISLVWQMTNAGFLPIRVPYL